MKTKKLENKYNLDRSFSSIIVILSPQENILIKNSNKKDTISKINNNLIIYINRFFIFNSNPTIRAEITDFSITAIRTFPPLP